MPELEKAQHITHLEALVLGLNQNKDRSPMIVCGMRCGAKSFVAPQDGATGHLVKAVTLRVMTQPDVVQLLQKHTSHPMVLTDTQGHTLMFRPNTGPALRITH